MAAPIITCPACTKKFKGKEGLEGKRIKCPLCATPFVVTAAQIKTGGAAQAKDKPAAAAGQTKSLQRVGWNKEDEDSTGYQLGEFDIRPRCPNCANLLESEEAVICLFCGYNTQTRTWGETVRAMSVTGGQHFAHLLPGIIFLIMLILFMVGLLFFCLELPPMVSGTWAWFFDHESMRMWVIGISLAFMYAFGWLAVRRLILNPRPKETEKEAAADPKKK